MRDYRRRGFGSAHVKPRGYGSACCASGSISTSIRTKTGTNAIDQILETLAYYRRINADSTDDDGCCDGPSGWLCVLDHARYVPRSAHRAGVLPVQGVVALFPESE